MNIPEINDRLLFEPDTPFETDTLILLGAGIVCGAIANAAAKGLAAGDFKRVIIAGGLPILPHRQSPKEADFIERRLLKHTPPSGQIIFVDNQSTNTGQNFENIRDIIKNQKIETAAVMCAAYTQRRAIETAAVQIPNLQVYPIPVYPFGISRGQWLKIWPYVPIIRGVVKGEFGKVNMQDPNNYYNQSHCKSTAISRLTP